MRAYFDSHNDDDDNEYDRPLFIFDDDDDLDQSDSSYEPSSSNDSSRDDSLSFNFDDGGTSSHSSASDDPPTFVPHFDDDDDFPEIADSDSDAEESISFSFGRVDTPSQPDEKEFIFMPFLDIPDEPEDDEEKISISFSKVKAEKKEKEFVFLPFLNISDEPEDDEEDTSSHGRFRSSKGTIIDEGLVLIPLEAEPEEEPEPEEPDEEEDSGISLVGGDITPRKPAPSKKPSGGKKRPSGSKGGKKSSGKKLDPEQQFRQAMRNIDPEILAAVRRDPIQRAALEQAVRIALVQQAAQEAVEKATGRPVFGQAFSGNQTAPKKKKKGNSAAQRPSTPYESTSRSKYGSSGRTVNVQASGVGIFDSAPAEFGVDSDSVSTQPTNFESSTPPSSPLSTSQYSSPNTHQDPALSALERSRSSSINHQPDATQDPALAALSSSASSAADSQTGNAAQSKPASSEKQYAATSPAAIRAAMRQGMDLASVQTATSNAAAANAVRREAETEVAKRSGCLVWIIVLFIAFFIGVLLIAVWPALSKEMNYQDASELLGSGKYVEAADAFSKLDDYKDSASKADEAYYLYASVLQENGDYLNAITYYNSVDPSYQDATERLAACRYNLGKDYLGNGDFAAAYDQLYLIPKYQDAGELAMQANYLAAEQLYADEKYDDARVRYSMFPDYQDSHEKWQTAQFMCAQNKFNDEKYKDAYALFSELGDYNFAPYHSALSLTQAVLGGASFSYEEMNTAMAELLRYPMDEAAQKALASHVFDMYLLAGNWTGDDIALTFTLSENENNSLSIDLAGTNSLLTYNDVSFKEGYVSADGDDDNVILQVVSFVTDTGAAPPSVTIYDYSTTQQYTLTRA